MANALFRIGSGLEEELPTIKTEGNVYFTIDTHNFYIDHKDSEGNLVRSQISAEYAKGLRYSEDGALVEFSPEEMQKKPIISAITLVASNWLENTYSFEEVYSSSAYNVEIELNGDLCTNEHVIAWSQAQIIGSVTTNIIKAMGVVPSIDIPVMVKVTVI